MAYQGRQPGVGVRNRFIYSATGGQTSFSGADSNGLTLAYSDATYVDVFLNGTLLVPVTDYAATTKTSVVLGSGAAASDIVEIVAYDISSMSDAITSSSGGTITGNLTVEGNFSADGGTIKLDGNYPVGTGNVALGDTALDSVQSAGVYNTAIGHNALTANTTATNNVSVGAFSLALNTTGEANTSVGLAAMDANTTGSNNVYIGYQAGRASQGTGNIFIGKEAGESVQGSNKLHIDNSNTSTPLIYGEFDNNKVVINGELSASSAIITGDITTNTLSNISTTLASDTATNVDTFATATYTGAIYDYILVDATVGARAGQFMVAQDNGSITFTDTSTKHLFDPTIPEITAQINGSNVEVQVTNGNGYTFKAFTKKL